MAQKHSYTIAVQWTGNTGHGTSNYVGYSRDHEVTSQASSTIFGTADPHFRGDPSRWNPEQLLLAAVVNCHMLSYLGYASRRGITVVDYTDSACGTMVENATDGGHYIEIILYPRVVVSMDSNPNLAQELHNAAHKACLISASVNFPVTYKPTIILAKKPILKIITTNC